MALLSGLVNVLYLTGSFFMLEVYDRVIPSRSVPTLLGLVGLAGVLYAFQGGLEVVRSRILSRIGMFVHGMLSPRVFGIIVRAPLQQATSADSLLPLRDLDQIRSVLSGSGLASLFDLPWMPIYVFICFLFDPLIGLAALGGAVALFAMTFAADLANRRPTKDVTTHGVARNSLAETGRSNAAALAALGMQRAFTQRWQHVNQNYMTAQQSAADIAGGFGALSKVFRTALQSAVLAVGAWLVIENRATSGIMIASSILVSRALAPVEAGIANWKSFVHARQSWRRLSDLLDQHAAEPRTHVLPTPCSSLSVEALTVCPPGSSRPAVMDVSFSLASGQGLGIIGPSASGKSTLAHALVGIWAPLRGSVRIDNASLDQWSSDDLGPNVGFLTQDVELFPGTIAENIARFEPDFEAQAVIAAAQAADVHDLILRLPQGYHTVVGENGMGLSAGQRQRIGLARALYKDPFLVVLDEPNSNLDNEGEIALTRAILGVRERSGICVVVAHRPSAIAGLDTMLIMAEGQAQIFGPKAEVMRRSLQPSPALRTAHTLQSPPLQAGAARASARVQERA